MVLIFEHTINHLSFDYVRLPQLEYYFLVLHFFSYFFSFSFAAIYLQTAERTAFKV